MGAEGKGGRPGQQRARWTKIGLAVFAGLALLWLVLGLATAKDDLRASKSAVTFMSEQEVSLMKLKSIAKIEAGTNDEWLPVLRHGKVVQILDIDEETTGLASKYKVVFESGHQALAKFAEPYRFLEPQWALETIQNAQLDDSLYPRRAGRKMQAWPEVAASAVARVIMPRRKVPVAMRQFSSKDWYGCQKCNGWVAWLKYWLPEHTVYVSVQAWIDRVRTTQPTIEYYKLLVAPPEAHLKATNARPLPLRTRSLPPPLDRSHSLSLTLTHSHISLALAYFPLWHTHTHRTLVDITPCQRRDLHSLAALLQVHAVC